MPTLPVLISKKKIYHLATAWATTIARAKTCIPEASSSFHRQVSKLQEGTGKPGPLRD